MPAISMPEAHAASDEVRSANAWPAANGGKDYFGVRDGKVFAGSHLIIDVWGAHQLNDIDHIDATLRRMVEAAGATLLHIHLHHFTPNGGVSGVAVLAESHISVHTWPERGYAAIDVFMCGNADTTKTIPVIRQLLRPDRIVPTELMRGRANELV